MPDYEVEVTEKVIYGPFTYHNANQLKEDIFNGKLKLADENGELRPMSIKVKELK